MAEDGKSVGSLRTKHAQYEYIEKTGQFVIESLGKSDF